QFKCRGSDVLLEPVHSCGTWNGNDPWLLRQQPRERDLRGCRLLAFCELRQPLDKREICLAVLRRETRDNVAEIGAVERRVLVDLPREEALAQRAERNEADSQRLKCGQHLFFGFSPPQRVLALKRCDRMNSMGAADRLHAGFGKAEVFDLA